MTVVRAFLTEWRVWTQLQHRHRHPVVYDQLTCISGSLRAWGRAAAGTPWWFARLKFNVKEQTLYEHGMQDSLSHQAWILMLIGANVGIKQAVLVKGTVAANETQRKHNVT